MAFHNLLGVPYNLFKTNDGSCGPQKFKFVLLYYCQTRC